MTRPELTRKDAVRNSERILDAAAEVFGRSGLDATLDDVARQAGVGVATVYRRFTDKEQLIDALFETRVGEVAEVAENALTVADPWEGICHLIYEFGSFLAADRGLMHLLLSASHGLARTETAKARMAPLVGELTERALAAGVLRPDITAADFPMIQILLSGVIDAAHDVRPDLWKRYAELILDGLRADTRPRVRLDVAALGIDQVHMVMHGWQPSRRSPAEG